MHLNLSLIFLLPAFYMFGYYAGYTWHQIGDPQPFDDFQVQVVMPCFIIWFFVAWLVVG